MVGQKFGKLTVISRAGSDNQRRALWQCQCDCGNSVVVRGAYLRNGHTTSCGCNKLLARKCKNSGIQIGDKFGKLTVLKRVENYISPKGASQPKFLCQCECGNLTSVVAQSLRENKTRSCGCINYSLGEKNIEEVLKTNNIKYFSEYKFQDLGLYRYDFYLPDYNRLIEFDGRQHFYEEKLWSSKETLEERQKKDSIKNQYAFSKNISLVRIPYTERDSINLDLILGDKYLIF